MQNQTSFFCMRRIARRGSMGRAAWIIGIANVAIMMLITISFFTSN